MEVLSRQAWGAADPKETRPWRAVTDLIAHWVGLPYIDPHASQAATASRIRGIQSYEMGKNYDDIAYNHAIDGEGRIWELRGFDVKSGANGNTYYNDHAPAIVYIAGRDADGTRHTELTDTAKRSFVALTLEYMRRFPLITQVRPHGAVRQGGTECPGRNVNLWLPELNKLIHLPLPVPPHEDDDMPAKPIMYYPKERLSAEHPTHPNLQPTVLTVEGDRRATVLNRVRAERHYADGIRRVELPNFMFEDLELS